MAKHVVSELVGPPLDNGAKREMPGELIGPVVAGFAIVTLQVTSAGLALRRRDPNGSFVLPQRLPPQFARAALHWQGALVAFLFLSYEIGSWSPESVGYRREFSPLASFGIGVAVFALVGLAYNWTTSRLGLRVLHDAAFRANRRMWPRDPRAKILMSACLILNPLTEELLMRGILVHQVGFLFGAAALPIAIGMVLNAATHAYQGWMPQAWHAAFFILSVSLLYSPVGLVGAIGAHASADLVPILSLRRQLRSVRNSRRRFDDRTPE